MDMRVKKTLKSLIESFEKLLNNNRYEDVTVSMLCENAMIRRTTFYKHFDDKDSFFKFYMTQKRAELEEICGANTGALDVVAYHVYMLDSLMTFLTDNVALVNNLIKSSQSSTLLDSLAEFMTSSVMATLKSKQKGGASSNVNSEYIGACVSGATIQTVKHWWANGHKSKDRSKVVQANAMLLPMLKESV